MKELSNFIHRPFYCSLTGRSVEGLYGKRPIQCPASSEILTPPPHRPASVYPPTFGAGGGIHSLDGEGVGVNSSEDARHYSVSVFYICKYFVARSLKTKPTWVETRERGGLCYSIWLSISKNKSMLESLHVLNILNNFQWLLVIVAIWKQFILSAVFFLLLKFVFSFSPLLPLPRGIGWGEENQREERRLEKWRRQKFA
jgi:hypothetical protein